MNAPTKITASTAPLVYTAINSVMATMASEGIGKDRKNEQQNYKFRGIDDVYNALARVLSDNKLVILPFVQDMRREERTTKNGGVLNYTILTVDFTLVSAEDGSQCIVRTIGEAMDSADKSANKAQSAALKYAAIQVFMIPTEGDNDADAHSHDVAPNRRPSAAVDMAINLLKGCGEVGMFKASWEKNFEGWKQVMDPQDYAKVQAVKGEMVKKFQAEAEEAKKREATQTRAAKPVEDFGISEDEIPW